MGDSAGTTAAVASDAQATQTATAQPSEGTKAEEAKEQKPTSRQRLTERYRKSRPDIDFDDDKAEIDFEGLAADELDSFDADRKARADMDEKMNNLFNSDERASKVFINWANGKDPIEDLLEMYGDDFTDALNSPEGKEKFSKSREAWRKNRDAEEEHAKLYDTNIGESAKGLIQFADSHKLSDDALKAIIEKAHEVGQSIRDGKYTPEILEMIYKAGKYDTDIEEAREEGRVTGKNENIRREIRKSRPATGLPPTAGEQTAVGDDSAPAKRKPKTIAMFGGIEAKGK